MKDLDMSDVLADAESHFDDYLHSLMRTDEVELSRLRYIWGSEARAGDTTHAIPIVTTIDWVRAGMPENFEEPDYGFAASYNPMSGQWDPIY